MQPKVVVVYWLVLFTMRLNFVQQLEFPDDVHLKIEDDDGPITEDDGTAKEMESSEEKSGGNSDGDQSLYYYDYINETLDYNQTYYEYQPDFNTTYDDLTSGSGSGAVMYWPNYIYDPEHYEDYDGNPFQDFLGEDYYQDVPETIYESLHEL
ncbi:protein E30A [Elephant endotheliotropic herpesvirus 3B]|nr:protein E30A [Elephant endotheliotropic herpesvirus 3B]